MGEEDGHTFNLALAEVQKQQEKSFEQLEAFTKQHHDWEMAVKALLQLLNGSHELAQLATAEGLSPDRSEAVGRPTRPSFSVAGPMVQKLRSRSGSNNQLGGPTPTSGNGSKDSTGGPAGAAGSTWYRRMASRDDSASPTEEIVSVHSATSMARSKANGILGKRSSSHGKILEEILAQPAAERKEERVERKPMQLLTRIVESNNFEFATGMIILANLVIIGAEAEMTVQNMDTSWARFAELSFLVVYTIELLIRFAVGSWSLFCNSWFLLDFFLVCVGLLALVIIPALEREGQDLIDSVLIVRGLRLLRLARVLRMVHRFKVVWRLISGLLTAWDTMVSTTGLIVIWLYIFGCVALEFITLDRDLLANPQTAEIVTYSFGTLPRATLTLLQFVTMDAIANVYYPLVLHKPALIIFFLPLLMFLSIGLMNLVTAVLVEHALEHASQEAELARSTQKQQIKSTLPDLLEVFQGLDTDGSGTLTRQELADVPVSALPPNVLENVSVDSMEELFEMLDVDGGGTLTQDEFLEGLLSLLLLDVPIWAIQLQKQLVQLHKTVTPINEMSMHMTEDLVYLKSFHEHKVAL